ncbi:CheY-P-specific phosphatase CheC [Pueribacillus theae]|uniref:CheY-P-specific phosphatase CheC n=1 Tax=Pueribacillus theae TaxID=2171751 RepID=A0A2U1K7N2_9BACI|nr:chemotaxis protein CheC [Pueribacillus theae]PWA13526.1 CheY-P-specific phosphatase CheC [Pueribacillus theae]
MTEMISKTNSFHLDILKEIGNIGAGHAATALSKLLRHPIDMNVPNVKIVSFDEMTDFIGGEETIIAAVFFRIEGDAPGSMFFMLELDQASKLMSQVTGMPIHLKEPPYDELAMSALQEVGNILTGSYLSALADFTKLNLHPSVPAVGIDMAGALINYGLIQISQVSDFAVVINTVFMEENTVSSVINGQVLLLPDPESFQTIFSALGVPLNE